MLPSKNAIRDKPSHFLKESTTIGWTGSKTHSATSLDFKEAGLFELFAASFLTNLEVQRRHLARRAAASDEANRGVASLQFTRDVQFGLALVTSLHGAKDVSALYTMTSPDLGMFNLSRPLTFIPTLSPGLAPSTRLWCISTVKPYHHTGWRRCGSARRQLPPPA